MDQLLAEILAAAVAAAHEIAEQVLSGPVKRFEIIFWLAKRLSGIPGAMDVNVSDLQPSVEAFCREISPLIQEAISPDTAWVKFLSVWRSEIKIPDGSN